MHDGIPELRVPTHPVAVTLALAGGGPRLVELYLAAVPEASPTHDEVAALLEHGPAFVPARDVEGAVMTLVNRANVVWVLVAPPDDTELYDHAEPASVELTDGTVVDGRLLYSAPPERARVADVANGPERFLSLWGEGGVRLVHKPFVRRIVVGTRRPDQR